MRTLAVALFSLLALTGCPGDAPNPAPNHAPIAVDDEAVTAEDTSIVVDVLANDTDDDGDALSIRAASADGHEVVIEAGAVRVTPAPDFNGEIEVEVEIDDEQLTATSTAVITVTPVNDAPTGVAATLTTSRNASGEIALVGQDVDGDVLSFEVVDAPGNGTLTGTAPNLTYTPALDYVGTDALRFVVRDASAASEPTMVEIFVTAGAPPVAGAIAATTAEDTPVDLILTGSDADGDALTFAVTTPPSHGTLVGTAPELTYVPDADFHGDDSFAYAAADGVLTSAPATVALTVTSVNDAPQAVATVATTAEDAAIPIALAGVDADGDALTYAVATGPAHGTVVVTGTTALYAPAPNFAGADAFTFTASDGTATSTAANVSLVITAVADAPVAVAQAAGAVEDLPLPIALAASDGDGDALSFTITTAPLHGTLTGAPPALVYTPSANYHGADSLVFVASDGALSSALTTVTITVSAVNDPPTAPGGTIAVVEDQAITFTLPGGDVDGDPLSYSNGTPPAHGTLTGSGATRTFVPDPNIHGNGSFVYSVYDGHVAVSGTITLAVASVNDVPIARDDVAVAAPGGAVTIGAVDNDEDADGDALTITIATAAAHGDVEISGGDLVYTPDAGHTGSDAFTYTIDDGAGGTATATVRVGTGQFPAGVPLAWIAPMLTEVPATSGVRQSLSADGRFLAFESNAALVPDDTNGHTDVYVHDRLDGGLERISITSAGAQANGGSYSPSISADGRYVAFYSLASNLVAGDVNTYADVFVHDRVSGITTCASVALSGAPGSLPSTDPQLSADGTIVAFTSRAFELLPSDANAASDVFVRDLAAGITTRVSVTSAGTEGDSHSNEPAVSADGRFVAFASNATNLVPGDANGGEDIFVHDRTTGVTERVSVTSTGADGGTSSIDPTLSADGRFVAFRSSSLSMVPGATHSGWKAFVRDRQEGTTTWAFQFSNSGTGQIYQASLSGDGRYLSGHLGNGAAFIRDRFADTIHVISPHNGADVFYPVLSSNGRYVSVTSAAALVPLPAGTTGTQAFVLPNPL